MWKECEGQLVDNRFPLRQFLASTRHSAVFLTEIDKSQAQRAVIKFISADIPAPDEQLAVWNEAKHLDHPNIIRVFDCGRTQVAGLDILYIVTERAEEDLSQLLTKRALSSEETCDLLKSLVEPLSYLHAKGLAHCHIKPSNLLANDDRLKLSSDTIFPSGFSRKAHRDMDAYDGPEHSGAAAVMATQPADIWSVGITLVEALTQQTPALPYDDSAELALSSTIPGPFLEIARGCLIRDPEQRWTVEEITKRLNRTPLVTAAGASAAASQSMGTTGTRAGTAATAKKSAPEPEASSRTTQRLPAVEEALATIAAEAAALKASRVPTVPVAPPNRPSSRESGTRVDNSQELPVLPPLPPLHQVKSQMQSRKAMPGYLLPIVLLSLLAVGVLLTAPNIFRRVRGVSSATSESEPSAAKQKPLEQPKAELSAPPVTEPKSTPQVTPPTEAPTGASSAEGAGLAPEVVSANSAKNGAVAVTKPVAGSIERGQVLDQVLPQASAKALATIHGTVRVGVHVKVDAAGNVSAVELNPVGPSKYFADLALRAAKQWQFSSPVAEGRSLPSQWDIRFEFTPKGVAAVPVPLQ